MVGGPVDLMVEGLRNKWEGCLTPTRSTKGPRETFRCLIPFSLCSFLLESGVVGGGSCKINFLCSGGQQRDGDGGDKGGGEGVVVQTDGPTGKFMNPLSTPKKFAS